MTSNMLLASFRLFCLHSVLGLNGDSKIPTPRVRGHPRMIQNMLLACFGSCCLHV